LNNGRGNNIKYLPYAFTEQGVAMLATILRTSVAAEVSIKIMRAFVIMKKYISSNLLEQKYVNNLVMKHEEQINNNTFNLVEFDQIKHEYGKNSFAMSPSQWIKRTNSTGIISKAGRYSYGTFAHPDIAFEFAS
jgi:hypothetical protein